MRTTLTLDPDVAALVQRARERGASLHEVVNTALRRGLRDDLAPRRPFQTRSADLGEPYLPNVDDVAGVLDELEAGA